MGGAVGGVIKGGRAVEGWVVVNIRDGVGWNGAGSGMAWGGVKDGMGGVRDWMGRIESWGKVGWGGVSLGWGEGASGVK